MGKGRTVCFLVCLRMHTNKDILHKRQIIHSCVLFANKSLIKNEKYFWILPLEIGKMISLSGNMRTDTHANGKMYFKMNFFLSDMSPNFSKCPNMSLNFSFLIS